MLIPYLLLLSPLTQDAPTVGTGFNSYFHQAVLKVEDRMAKADFAGAADALDLLPKSSVKVYVDVSGTGAATRDAIEAIKERVAQQFSAFRSGISIHYGKADPDVRISFVNSIPQEADQPHAPGAAYLVSDAPKDARVEAVIALNRGNPTESSRDVDIQADMQYAIGMYYGLSSSRLGGNIMARSDLALRTAPQMTPSDVRVALDGLKIVEVLRKAIGKKVILQPARPQLMLSPLKIEGEEATQGDRVPFSVQVTNTGNSLLLVGVRPDCGCVTVTPGLQLQAGESGLIKVSIDTTEFPGDLKKTLVIFSNDSDFPIRELPITFKVGHRYRFVAPSGETILMQDGGVSTDVYLVFPGGKPLDVSAVQLDGIPGTVTYEAWSGKLNDPELGGRELKGFKFKLSLDDALPPGQSAATLVVDTPDEVFSRLRFNIKAQKGIIAQPEQVYFGEAPRAAWAVIVLARPEVDFEVVKVETDNPHLKASCTASRGKWEHKVKVQYDGKAPTGDLRANVIIHTTDPKQPTITVPVRAVIP